MPFNRIVRAITGGAAKYAAGPEIRMSASLAVGTGKPKQVNISLNVQALAELGIVVESKDIRVYMSVDEGWGDDAGFWILTPSLESAPNTYSFASNAKAKVGFLQGSVAFPRIKHYVLNECPTPHEPVEYSAQDGGFLIQCPDWLRYNPQSVTNEMLSEQIAPGYRPPEPEPEPEPPELPRAEEVKTPTQRPPTVRHQAIAKLKAGLKDDETGEVLNLNRTQRRRVASTVARAFK